MPAEEESFRILQESNSPLNHPSLNIYQYAIDIGGIIAQSNYLQPIEFFEYKTSGLRHGRHTIEFQTRA